jgi:hypothetical protein
MDEKDFNLLSNLYEINPSAFTDDDVYNLEQEAPKFGFTFKPKEEARPFNLFNGIKQMMYGFAEGFSTINVSEWAKDQPKNETEQVFHSIGSLLGFIGYIPGPGLAGKLGLSAVGRALKLGGLAELSKAPMAFKLVDWGSVPMGGANLIMGGIKKVTKNGAALEAVKFLKSGSLGRDLLEGGMHLGAASAIAGAQPWELNVNERLESALYGVALGVGNRAIGNLIGRGGKFSVGEAIFKGDALELKDMSLLKKQNVTDMISRGIASGLFMGLPATAQGLPLPLQVYEYTSNFLFGMNEMSRFRRKAIEVSQPYNVNPAKRSLLLMPEKEIPNFKNLEPQVQRELKIQAEIEMGGMVGNYTASRFIASAGMEVADLEGARDRGEISENEYQRLRGGKIIADELDKTIKKYPNDEEKAMDLALDNAKKIIYEEAKQKDIVATKLKELTNFTLETPDKMDDKLSTIPLEIENMYDKMGVSKRYNEPFRKIAETIAAKKGAIDNTEEGLLKVGEMQKELIRLAKETSFKGEKGYSEFKQAIKDKFDTQFTDSEERALRYVFVRTSQSKLRPVYNIVRRKGKEDTINTAVKPSQNESTYYPSPFLDKLLDDTTFEIKNVIDTDGNSRSVYERMSPMEIILHAYTMDRPASKLEKANGSPDLIKGAAVYSGKKADDVLVAGKFLISSKAEIDERINAAKEYWNDDYESGKKEFIEEGLKTFEKVADEKGTKIPDELQSKVRLAAIYDHLYANNVEMLARFNGFSEPDTFIEWANSEGVKAVLEPSALNKRFQVFNAREPKADDDWFKNNIEDGKEGSKFVILNSNNKDKSPNTNFEDDSYYYYALGKDKEPIRIKYEAMRDGGVLVRSDVFDKMTEYFGYEGDISSLKGVQIQEGNPDDGLGGFIGKLAWHRADSETSNEMKKSGLHYFHFDTTAKQRGMRKALDWTYDKNIQIKSKKPMAEDPKLREQELGIYNLPWSSITVNAGENRHGAIEKRQKVAKQFSSLIDGATKEGLEAQEVLHNFLDEQTRGVKEVNDEIDKALNGENIDVDKIDIDDISAQKVLDILRSSKNTKLWTKTAKHILNMDNDEDEVIDRESIRSVKELDVQRGKINKLLDNMPITPQTLQIYGVREYFEAAVKRYTIERYQSPRVKNSAKLIMLPHDPVVSKRLGGIKPGYWYANDGVGNVRIKGDITLRQAWEAKQKGKLKELGLTEEDLRHVMVRTPAGDASAVRVLEFGGFTGVKGYGMVLHPEEMVNADGADTDIDSGFMYFQMPKEVKDYYASQRYKRYNKVGNKLVFKEAKTNIELLQDKPKLYKFSPLSNVKANSMAYTGNMTLGPGLALSNRLKVLWNKAAIDIEKTGYLLIKRLITVKDKNGKPAINKKGKPIMKLVDVAIGKPDFYKAKEEFDGLVIDVVNYAADSADGIQLMPVNHIKNTLIRKSADAGVKLDGDDLNDMMVLDQIGKGFSYNKDGTKKRFSIGDSFKLAAEMKAKGVINNVYYRRIMDMGELSYGEPGFDIWLGNSTNIAKVLNKATNFMGSEEGKALIRYSGLGLLKTPAVNLLGKKLDYNERLKEKADKYNGDLEKARRELNMNAAGDFMDIASAVTVAKYGEAASKLTGGVRRLQDIINIANNYKQRTAEYVKSKGENGDSLASIENDIVKYREGLNSAEKKYFSALWVSSLKKQYGDKSLDKQLDTRFNKNSTSFSFVEPEVLKTLTNNFQKVTELTFDSNYPKAAKKLETSEIKDLPKNLGSLFEEQYGVKTDIPGLAIENTVEAKRIGDMVANSKQVLKDTKGVKVSSEIEKLSKEYAELVNKYPGKMIYGDDLFAAYTLEQTGTAKTFDVATLPEFKGFIEYIKNSMNRKPGGLPLKKSDYFLFPDSLTEKHNKYDDGMTDQLTYVLTKGEKGESKLQQAIVRMPLSKMGELQKTVAGKEGYNDKQTRQVDDYIFNGRLMKFINSIDNSEKGSGKKLFEIAVAFRERNLSEEHNKIYKAYKKRFSEQYKDKKWNITTPKGTKVVTSAEAVNLLDGELTMMAEKAFQHWTGDEKAKAYMDKYISGKGTFGELIDYDAFIADMTDKFNKGEAPNIGIDNLDKAIHSRFVMEHDFNGVRAKDLPKDKQIQFLEDKFAEVDEEGKKIFPWIEFTRHTKALSFNEYFPHRNFAQKELKRNLELSLKDAKAKGDSKLATKETLRYISVSSQDAIGIGSDIERMYSDFLINDRKPTAEDMYSYMANKRAGHQKSRSKFPNYSYERSVNAWAEYEREAVKTYWDKLTSITGDKIINDFLKQTDHIGDEYKKYWGGFMRIYLSNGIGSPSILPEEYTKDPGYKIKGNPYYSLTDEYWINKLDKHYKRLDKKLGLKAGKEVNVYSERSVKEMLVSRRTAWISNLEAKWNLVSLLSSFKTMGINIMTGNANTVVSTGWRHWKKAGDLAYLKSINPAIVNEKGERSGWETWADIEKDVDTHGGIESFIKDMANLSMKFTSADAQRFLEEATAKIKKNPYVDDYTIMELAKKNGLTEQFMQGAGWFMRKSERMVRRRAWIAHYLKARELFDANNFAFPKWDDPYLVAMANKGVAATQFLYNAANRPAFARTSLGKMATRFQLFALNSMKWRKDIYNSAKIAGFKAGTEEYKRFERMAAMDLMAMTLATTFPISLFGGALPPPYNYLQGFADFLFGDDKERERAFFGTLPYPANILQPVLPPSARLLTSTLTPLMTGEWERFADYHVWTFFPFGRMANDARKSLENPYMFMERNFGIPFNTAVTEMARQRKRNEEINQ